MSAHKVKGATFLRRRLVGLLWYYEAHPIQSGRLVRLGDIARWVYAPTRK